MPTAQADPIRDPVHERGRPFIKACPDQAETVAPGIRRQFLGYGDALMGVRVWFSKGAIGEVHAHPHTQMSYVESGAFRVRVGSQEQVLTAGDSFYVAPDSPHGAVCLEDGVLIDMFTPAREDFLASSGGA